MAGAAAQPGAVLGPLGCKEGQGGPAAGAGGFPGGIGARKRFSFHLCLWGWVFREPKLCSVVSEGKMGCWSWEGAEKDATGETGSGPHLDVSSSTNGLPHLLPALSTPALHSRGTWCPSSPSEHSARGFIHPAPLLASLHQTGNSLRAGATCELIS